MLEGVCEELGVTVDDRDGVFVGVGERVGERVDVIDGV